MPASDGEANARLHGKNTDAGTVKPRRRLGPRTLRGKRYGVGVGATACAGIFGLRRSAVRDDRCTVIRSIGLDALHATGGSNDGDAHAQRVRISLTESVGSAVPRVDPDFVIECAPRHRYSAARSATGGVGHACMAISHRVPDRHFLAQPLQ